MYPVPSYTTLACYRTDCQHTKRRGRISTGVDSFIPKNVVFFTRVCMLDAAHIFSNTSTISRSSQRPPYMAISNRQTEQPTNRPRQKLELWFVNTRYIALCYTLSYDVVRLDIKAPLNCWENATPYFGAILLCPLEPIPLAISQKIMTNTMNMHKKGCAHAEVKSTHDLINGFHNFFR